MAAQRRDEAKFRLGGIDNVSYEDNLFAVRGKLGCILSRIIICQPHMFAARHAADVKFLPPILLLYVSDHLRIRRHRWPAEEALRRTQDLQLPHGFWTTRGLAHAT